jgi:hypothetical protein
MCGSIHFPRPGNIFRLRAQPIPLLLHRHPLLLSRVCVYGSLMSTIEAGSPTEISGDAAGSKVDPQMTNFS